LDPDRAGVHQANRPTAALDIINYTERLYSQVGGV